MSRGPFLLEFMEATSWTNLNMMISPDLHGVQILWWLASNYLNIATTMMARSAIPNLTQLAK